MKTPLIAAAMLACAGVALADDIETPQSKLSKPVTMALDDMQQLPGMVVTATRNPEPETQVGSAFTRIDLDEMGRAQYIDLQQALNTAPGVVAIDAGARGGYAEVTIRGNRASDTLVFLDGVRLNTGIFQTAEPFFAYAGTANLDDIEIIRGPQSTLYGSDGIGGVIAMETRRGEGTPGVEILGEAGSFDSFRESIASQGALGKADYSLSYERDDTQNERPNNDLAINRYSLRLDYQVLDTLSLRLNVCGLDGRFEEPGSDRPQDFASNDPSSHTVGQTNLGSAIIEWKVCPQWTQKFTLGIYFEHYILFDPPYPRNFFTLTNYFSHAIDYSLDWQNTVRIASNNRVTAGFDFNEFTGHDNTFTDTSISDWAFYGQDEWEPVKNLNLTGGARFDRYQQAGDAFTWRTTGAYLFSPTDTKIRASYGTAFEAPSLFELFSNSTASLGSRALKAEKSDGWDAGVDQYLLNRTVVLSATYFRNNIRDLIAFVETSPVTGFYVNRDRGENSGAELAAQLNLFRNWKTRLAYTWLTSTDTVAGVTLRRDRLPRHALDLDTNCLFFGKWLLGCGVSFTGNRVDTDFSTFPATQMRLADYWTLRVYSRYDVNPHFGLFVRGENVTSARYQDALGYPGLPLGVYGGVDLKF